MIEEEKINNQEEISETEAVQESEPKEEAVTEEASAPKEEGEEANGKKKKEKKPKSKARKIVEWTLTILFAIVFVFMGIGQIDALIHKKENFNQSLPYGYGSMIVRTNSMEPEYKVNSAIITYKKSGDAIFKQFTKENTAKLISEEGTVKTYTSLWADTDEARHYKYVDLTFAYIPCNYMKPTDTTTYNYQTNTNPPAQLRGYPMTHRLFELRVDESVKLGEGRYLFFTTGINPEGNESHPGQYQAFTEKEIIGVVVMNSVVLGGFFGFISSPWGLLVFLLIPAFYLVITSVLDIFRAMKDPEEEAAGAEGEKKKENASSLDGLSEKDRARLKQQMLDEMMNKKKGD